MDFEVARRNMIEQQIRPWEVLDLGVLELFEEIHREDFVPEPFRQLALADTTIPLAHGEVTMTPKVEARIIQCVAVSASDRVLEIGTGCGFLTAVLARTAGSVLSVDIHPEFTRTAREKLGKYGDSNVELVTGDGVAGWPSEEPFDIIVVTGSLPVYTDVFQRQLAVNGRLFAIIGTTPVMEATLVSRTGPEEWTTEVLFETAIPPLIGAPRPEEFEF